MRPYHHEERCTLPTRWSIIEIFWVPCMYFFFLSNFRNRWLYYPISPFNKDLATPGRNIISKMKIPSPKYIIAIVLATAKIPTIIFFTRLLVVDFSSGAVSVEVFEEMVFLLLWTVIADSYLQFTKSLNSRLNSIYVALGYCFCNLFNL